MSTIIWAFRNHEQTVRIAFPEFFKFVRWGDSYGYVPETREFWLLGPSGKRMCYLINDQEIAESTMRKERNLTDEEKAILESDDYMDVQIYDCERHDWQELGFSDPNNWLIALMTAARDAQPTALTWDYPEV